MKLPGSNLRSIMPNPLNLPEPGLHWLLRLRWLAVAGQLATCVTVGIGLNIPLPWSPLLILLAITAFTNALAMRWPSLLPQPPEQACAVLLIQDTLVLTAMLWLTGGIHNPFASFYLLHVVIGAMLLSRPWRWVLVGFCTICFGLQSFSPHDLFQYVPQELHASIQNFGTIFALLLVSATISLFVGRLRISLAERDQELHRARELTARNERFAALATLSAGVAHELATPLSTIAVVSSDLVRQADSTCRQGECLSDARLIRSEVDRCRAVLESLSQQTTGGIGDASEALGLEQLPERLRPYLKDDNFRRTEIVLPEMSTSLQVPITALLQTLAVLVKNACEASPPSSPVRLIVTRAESGTLFTVEDSGTGMPPEMVARVGEPFFTTKPAGKGMGLGLFLVRTFVERVNGNLDIDSQVGEGTSMRLWIPSPGNLS